MLNVNIRWMIEDKPTKLDHNWNKSLNLMAVSNSNIVINRTPTKAESDNSKKAVDKYNELVELYTRQYSEQDEKFGISKADFEKSKENQINELKNTIRDLGRADLLQMFANFVGSLKQQKTEEENKEIVDYLRNFFDISILDKDLMSYLIDVEKRLRKLGV